MDLKKIEEEECVISLSYNELKTVAASLLFVEDEIERQGICPSLCLEMKMLFNLFNMIRGKDFSKLEKILEKKDPSIRKKKEFKEVAGGQLSKIQGMDSCKIPGGRAPKEGGFIVVAGNPFADSHGAFNCDGRPWEEIVSEVSPLIKSFSGYDFIEKLKSNEIKKSKNQEKHSSYAYPDLNERNGLISEETEFGPRFVEQAEELIKCLEDIKRKINNSSSEPKTAFRNGDKKTKGQS